MRIVLATLMAILLIGCSDNDSQSTVIQAVQPQETFEWKLVTTWPKNYPGLGLAPENFASKVAAMSAGRLKVKVYGAGQLVPAFEVFDAVSQGTAGDGPWRILLLDWQSEGHGVLHISPFRFKCSGDEWLAALWWWPRAMARTL